ncbi:alpha/beta hydrolase [Streptomyces sp. NPDC097619]|uniref:alpha/beta fold hydrolase n=1 Tax=Streptomyces sp. NPDC097619 TaxID=3157228 RepID=UPI003327090E
MTGPAPAPAPGTTPAPSQGEPGRAPTRDGRTLHHLLRPGPAEAADRPTVVLEGGLACSRSYWAPVQERLAPFVTTVVYDRSGLGSSAPDPAPRTLARLAADLGDLLAHLGPRPYVLAGHSWGGPVVRLAAAARPERIAGVVLLDPTEETCDLVFSPAMRRQERFGQRASAALARAGLLAHAYRGLLAALPPDAAADMRREGFTPAAMRTRAAELASVVPDLTGLLHHPPELPGIPLTVVSAGRTSVGMGHKVRAAATASHAHRAGLASRGRHVTVGHGDHMLPLTAPGAVAEEILRLAAPPG